MRRKKIEHYKNFSIIKDKSGGKKQTYFMCLMIMA